MAFYSLIFRSLRDAQVPFLVVGGHAVVLSGHLRNTFDIDLLIGESVRDTARQMLSELGFRIYFESEVFLQLAAPHHLPPLDLMVVEDDTFARLLAHTEEKILDDETILIPDPLRLIALKLHATKSRGRRRRNTDWDDIVGVLRATRIPIDDPELQVIVGTYGGTEAWSEIRERFQDSSGP
jgi:hypothetical protein